MKRRPVRLAPVSAFYSSVVAEAQAIAAAPGEPVRAIAAGVENVRLAVGHAARAIDEAAPAPEIDASIHEGVVSVEKAVHTATQPGADATHEGVESVRAAVARETPVDTSGAVTRPGDHRHPSR